jgi:hypothetical protein
MAWISKVNWYIYRFSCQLMLNLIHHSRRFKILPEWLIQESISITLVLLSNLIKIQIFIREKIVLIRKKTLKMFLKVRSKVKTMSLPRITFACFLTKIKKVKRFSMSNKNWRYACEVSSLMSIWSKKYFKKNVKH